MTLRADEDLRNSVYDGVFANMYATLTGGAFLTGFALHMGMAELQIGMLASLPYLVTLFQLPAAHYLVRRGRRKLVCARAALGARLIWVPVLAFAFLPFSAPVRNAIVLLLLFFSYGLTSVSYVSWLSWTTELVPDSIRGSFFGTRNMLCGAAGMVVMGIFGQVLDGLERWGNGALSLGFVLTIGSAIGFGWLSVRFLNRISEPNTTPLAGAPMGSFRQVLRDANFRRYLWFTACWGFAVYFASPFLNLYLLRDLGFGYGFVAGLGVLSALADLVGMRLWGALSDRVKNRPIIRLAGWVAALLPLGWLTFQPESWLLPVFFHLLGGSFWSGINLCTGNLLLRIAMPGNRPHAFSIYAIVGGLGAAAGPLLAGLVVHGLESSHPVLFGGSRGPLPTLFLLSAALRAASLLLLNRVREPEEATMVQMIRVIRSIRGLTTAAGFNYLLHPFVEISRDLRHR